MPHFFPPWKLLANAGASFKPFNYFVECVPRWCTLTRRRVDILDFTKKVSLTESTWALLWAPGSSQWLHRTRHISFLLFTAHIICAIEKCIQSFVFLWGYTHLALCLRLISDSVLLLLTLLGGHTWQCSGETLFSARVQVNVADTAACKASSSTELSLSYPLIFLFPYQCLPHLKYKLGVVFIHGCILFIFIQSFLFTAVFSVSVPTADMSEINLYWMDKCRGNEWATGTLQRFSVLLQTPADSPVNMSGRYWKVPSKTHPRQLA